MALSHWAKRLAGTSIVALSLGTLIAASSCAEAEGRFFVECVNDTETCGCEDLQLSRGSYNAATCAANGICNYGASFVLRSGMTSSLDSAANNNRVETSDITVYAYDVSYETNGPSIPSVEGATVVGHLEPEGSLCAGISLDVVEEGTVAEGEEVEVIAAVTFYGRTSGGLEVESPEQYFSFVIVNTPCSCDEGEGEGEGGIPGWNNEPVLCPADQCGP